MDSLSFPFSLYRGGRGIKVFPFSRTPLVIGLPRQVSNTRAISV